MVERWWLDAQNIERGFLIPGVHPVFLLGANAEVGPSVHPRLEMLRRSKRISRGRACGHFVIASRSLPRPPSSMLLLGTRIIRMRTRMERPKSGSTTFLSPRTGLVQ
eukprot:8087655-Pyramimonas_sp.AAC.1